MRICSGENMLWGEEEIIKKGENVANFRQNGRDFAKNRGNFRKFCSEKKNDLEGNRKNFLVRKKIGDFLKEF